MDSILTSIKKLLGLSEDDTSFDADIVMYINSAFSILKQLGIGPVDGYFISDKNSTWQDYLGDNYQYEFADVEIYVYLKVKLWFDSNSLTSSVIESIGKQISELEWRINVAIENDTER